MRDGSDKSKVALVLSLSGKIASDEYERIVGDVPVYEIEVEVAVPDFLSYKSRLQKFGVLYRQALSDIRTKYGGDCVIHLFPQFPLRSPCCAGRSCSQIRPFCLGVRQRQDEGGVNLPTLTIN